MPLIPDNPIKPIPVINATQAGNTAAPVDVTFTIDDVEMLWQAKQCAKQDTHAYVTAFIADPASGMAGGPLDKLFNALIVELATDTVTK